ncbi:GH32 C-terminal domain-containing protein [Acidipropionibacterium thoenii]|uniref:GH32 C-terminal domain-containing protein n=1 Tax=Acidipropionibacterium thoenii TaxID=1751 RepID=UPI0003F5D64B|nr:GH32 C-terminal domain-containing protein [Acidipropionibacterium thoenii]
MLGTVEGSRPGEPTVASASGDPRIIRDDAHRQWVRITPLGDRLQFQISSDQLSWTPSGSFGGPRWHDGGNLSHPDLFPLSLHGVTRWVLWWTSTAAPQTNGSTTRYAVGNWDGRRFTPDTRPEQVLRVDLGRDLYRPVSHLDAATGRRTMIATLGNEDYPHLTATSCGGPVPGMPASCTTRELALVRTPAGPRLSCHPLTEVTGQLAATRTVTGQPITACCDPLSGLGGQSIDAEVELEASAYDHCAAVILQVRCDSRVHTDIVWRPAEGSLTLDRSQSGATEFTQWFTTPHPGPGVPAEQLLRASSASTTVRWPASSLGVMRRVWLRIIADADRVEVFSPDGLTTITSAIRPGPGATGMRLTAAGPARLVRATVHPMALH